MISSAAVRSWILGVKGMELKQPDQKPYEDFDGCRTRYCEQRRHKVLGFLNLNG